MNEKEEIVITIEFFFFFCHFDTIKIVILAKNMVYETSTSAGHLILPLLILFSLSF